MIDMCAEWAGNAREEERQRETVTEKVTCRQVWLLILQVCRAR